MSKVFSPKRVNVSAADVTLAGFSDNSLVKIDYSVDQVELDKGLDGETCFLVIADDSAVIEVSLKGSSQTNLYLMQLWQRQRALLQAHHVSVRDRNGGANAFKAEGMGMIVRPPARDIGKGPGDAVWKFIVEHLEESGGGVAG